MTEQLALIPAPAKEPILTPRQAYALELVQAAGTGGMHSDELGAQLHAEYRKHSADDRCTWCGQTGKSILEALKKKGLVRYRRGSRGLPGYWQANGFDKADEMPRGMTDVIPY